MIIIFSEAFDMSTDDVCDWLAWYGQPFIRINGSDFSHPDCSYSIVYENNKPKISFNIKGKTADSTTISAVWFRRDEGVSQNEAFRYITDQKLRQAIVSHAYSEITRAKEYFYTTIKDLLPHLGDHMKKDINKFHALSCAAKNGLKVPQTILSNDREQQQDFVGRYDCIIKSIKDTNFFTASTNDTFISYTSTVHKDDGVSNSNFPNLMQQKIDKDIEIRIFFAKGKCYAMAIFSQLDDKTSVDFRKYNLRKPNRNVPYKLPLTIECALIATMKDIGLDSGSIDMIKDKNGDFFFLEVNPVGQFGMTSKPCNYYVERDIAQLLIASN